jgi:hypothetical protein
VEHILRTTERWFAVDDPMFSKQWPEPRGEDLRLSEWRQIAGKVQVPSLKSRLESVDELSAKYAPEHVDGEKESRVRPNPAGVIEREPTRRDDAVDMGMNLEFLIPGMQHSEEANLGAEMPGITSHFEESFCTGAKQQIIDDFLVVQSQRSQLRRQSENDMDVGRGQKFAATCLDPAFTSAGLTLWAMAVTATVIGDGSAMSTTRALIDVAAECGGTTTCNSEQDLNMCPTEPLTVAFDESGACGAD